MVPIGFRSWRLSVVSTSDSRSWSANERSPILLSIFSFFGTQHSAHHWAIYMFATFIAIGVYVFIAQYLPLVLGLSPLQAGLWTLPWAFSFIVGSNLTPPIARRVSPVSLLTSGLLISAVGFTIITQVHGTFALRYLQQAQKLKQPVPVEDAKVSFTVKLSRRLVEKLRRYAASTGWTLSEIVSRAVQSVLQQGGGRG